MGPMNHLLDWFVTPHAKSNFGGCPTYQKALGVTAAVCAAKGIVII